MKYSRPIPTSNEQWLSELSDAYLDAKAAMPFGSVQGTEISEADLFHIAPLVCLKFRGIQASEENRKKATDAAIGSYIANEEANNGILKNAVMAFSFCYILAHYGLKLLNDEASQHILLYIEHHLDSINTL